RCPPVLQARRSRGQPGRRSPGGVPAPRRSGPAHPTCRSRPGGGHLRAARRPPSRPADLHVERGPRLLPGDGGRRRLRHGEGPHDLSLLEEHSSESGRPARSINTGTCATRPPLSSSRRSRHTAIPPMFPIWRSTTAISGARSWTAARTALPVTTWRTVTSGPISTDSTASRIQGASVAISTSGTVTPSPAGPQPRLLAECGAPTPLGAVARRLPRVVSRVL